jgi:hypothetical protein
MLHVGEVVAVDQGLQSIRKSLALNISTRFQWICERALLCHYFGAASELIISGPPAANQKEGAQ